MEHEEHEEGMEEHWGHHMGCCSMKSKKEFKLAMLEKKEKMLEAKLEFVRKIKSLVEKEPAETEKDE